MLIGLLKTLLTYQGISPGCGGAINFLAELFESRGFKATILRFGDINNLLVHSKDSREIDLCFAGHVDVVPPVDVSLWSCDPFIGEVTSEGIFGRGVVDMKGAIACFIAALFEFLESGSSLLNVGLILTSDEELSSVDGMIPMVSYLEENNYMIRYCIVGEPTCEVKVGDVIKIGRRGSLNTEVTYAGIQGHVAYPQKAKNPIPEMIGALEALKKHVFDRGNEFFPPSHCEITSVDVGNSVTNIIPGKISACFNIRFNTLQTVDGLKEAITSIFANDNCSVDIKFLANPALPFLSKKGSFADKLSKAVLKCTGISPALETIGGTSDARFLYKITDVLEFGLLNKTAHKIDEYAPLSDLFMLKDVYLEVLKDF